MIPGTLRKRLSKFMCRYVYYRHIGIDGSINIDGIPIISGWKIGKLTVGKHVSIISHPRGTWLGVRAPTIIRIMAPGGCIAVGDGTGLSGTVICAAKSVKIGKNCLIGADVMIFDTDFHNISPEKRAFPPEWDKISSPVSIGDNVFIGTRAIIMKGVTIGNGSVIGAGSVVTSDIPENTIYAGSPAKFIKKI